MIRIRPYRASDAEVILSWCQNERAFYEWSAGVLGAYPITPGEFRFVESLMPFTAFDERGTAGFFTLRTPGGFADELRFGFVIVDPQRRGRGRGKAQTVEKALRAFPTRGTCGQFSLNFAKFRENHPAAALQRTASGTFARQKGFFPTHMSPEKILNLSFLTSWWKGYAPVGTEIRL